MVLELNQLVGGETEGLEETTASVGSVTAETTIVAPGGSRASFKMNGGATKPEISLNIIEPDTADQGNDLIFGLAFRTTFAGPTTTFEIFDVLFIGIELDAVAGTINLTDDSKAVVASALNAYSANTWHYLELRVTEADGGDFPGGAAAIWLDGKEIMRVTSKNFLTSPQTVFDIRGTITVSEDVYIDDIYVLSGVTSDNERFGTLSIRSYQNTVEDATDIDDPLDSGTWGNMGDTPLNEGTSGTYANENDEGGTIMDEGARPGPTSDSGLPAGLKDANIKGASWLWRLRASVGGDTRIKYGNSGDGFTNVTQAITTSFVNYRRTDDSEFRVPLTTEDFQMGTGMINATVRPECAEMWAMLAYVQPGVLPAGSLGSLGVGK